MATTNTQVFPEPLYKERRCSTYTEATEPHLKLTVPPSPVIRPASKPVNPSSAFKLPMPCQSSGVPTSLCLKPSADAGPHPHDKRRRESLSTCFSADLYDRRPDLETMLLDALEVSIGDTYANKKGSQPPIERHVIKSQIEATMMTSQMQILSLITKETNKRKRESQTDANFTASPVLSCFQLNGSQDKGFIRPKKRVSAPVSLFSANYQGASQDKTCFEVPVEDTVFNLQDLRKQIDEQNEVLESDAI